MRREPVNQASQAEPDEPNGAGGQVTSSWAPSGWAWAVMPLLLPLLLLLLLLWSSLLPVRYSEPSIAATAGQRRPICLSEASYGPPPPARKAQGTGWRSQAASGPGCAFFWLLFFAQAKKSDSAAAKRLAKHVLTFRRFACALACEAGGKARAGAELGGAAEGLKQSFRQRLRRLGESLFLCSCKEKVTKKKAGPGRKPADEAGRSSARLASMGDGPQLASLRHVGLSAPIAAAMLGSLYGEGKQQQQPRQQQQQQQQQQQKQKRQQLPRQQRRRRRRAPPNSGSRRVDQSACRCPEDPLFRQVP